MEPHEQTTQTKPNNKNQAEKLIRAGICPDCGAQLAHEGGCVASYSCGFSCCS